jgi:glucokinase
VPYASGSARVLEVRELATVDPARARRLPELSGADVQLIDGHVVTRAARECDPEVFVLAGDVADAGELLLGSATAAFEQRLTARTQRNAARVLLTGLSGDAGMIVAADLARGLAASSSTSAGRGRRAPIISALGSG